MIQLIAGRKGKGKTKQLLDKVNAEIKTVSGNITYLDKSTKHMFELNNRVRLINVTEYMVSDADEFIGFVSGIISQDHDLEQMYFDSFLKVSHLEGKDITATIQELDKIGKIFDLTFILSVSLDRHEIPETIADKIHIEC